MEALVRPGGGPPPHIHTRADETYYLLAGQIEVLLGEETIVAGPNDFVNIPPAVPCTASVVGPSASFRACETRRNTSLCRGEASDEREG
jgi:mannose-6-phosphate isomerase-like protein (cupin superfamily)